MLRLCRAMCVVAIGLIALNAAVVGAQEYPTRPVRTIAIGPGGGSDFVARLLAQGLSVNIGQQFVVENRAAGVISGQVVSQAAADGYTLLIAPSSFMTGSLLQKTPYDVITDFSPIILIASSPGLVVLHPSVPVRSIKELIVLAKARPGELNYASSGTGSATHIAAELFKSLAGVDIVRINYKGAGVALNELIAGQVQLMFPTAGGMAPYIKSGRLRALAVTSAHPSELLPGLPTVASTLPGYEAAQLYGMFAPAKTPTAIIHRLNQEVVRMLEKPDIKEKLFAVGVEPMGGTPDQLAAAEKGEITRLSRVIKDANIHVE